VFHEQTAGWPATAGAAFKKSRYAALVTSVASILKEPLAVATETIALRCGEPLPAPVPVLIPVAALELATVVVVDDAPPVAEALVVAEEPFVAEVTLVEFEPPFEDIELPPPPVPDASGLTFAPQPQRIVEARTKARSRSIIP
jgi:hypothetical protein